MSGKLTVGLVLLVIVVAVALFLLSAAVLMWLANVPLTYYGAKALDYNSALAITGLLWIFGGAAKVNNGKD